MSRSSLFRSLPAGLALLVTFAPVSPAAAQDADDMVVLEQIVATVDDEVVLLGELVADLQYFAMQSGQFPPPEQQRGLLEEARESRIKEKLLIAKAQRDEVQVGEEEIEMAMDRHIDHLKEQAGGEMRFQMQLEREDMNERDLRRDLEKPLRDQLLAQRVIERVGYGLEVNDEELRGYYDQHVGDPDRIPTRPRAAELSHIVVMPRPAPEQEKAIEAKHETIRARLESGEDFAEVARAMSEGPAAARGGDLGWWKLEEIAVTELAYGIANLAPGARTEVPSDQGLHIVEMIEREGDRVHFRQILLLLPIGEEQRQAARDRAREAWKRLQEGADWDTVVMEYSEDEPTRESGGRLSTIPEEQLDERYRNVVEMLEPGEYSGVFLGLHGYQILRLESREAARPFEFDEIADQLRADLLGRKRNQAIEAYLGGLEDEVIVVRQEIPALETIAALGGAQGTP